MHAVWFVLLAGVFGDIWNWVSGVFARIGDIAVYWLVIGLAFKTGESALLGLVWRNILRAAYPKSNLVQDRLGRLAGRDGDQRARAGAGWDGGDDRHLPDQHRGVVGRGHQLRLRRPGALLHRDQHRDGGRGGAAAPAHRLEGLALG